MALLRCRLTQAVAPSGAIDGLGLEILRHRGAGP